MSAPPPVESRDWITPRGVEILDELCVALLECRLVIRNIAADIGLTLDDLDRHLRTTQSIAEAAYGAARLIDSGAEMASSWSNYPARPQAVFARHLAAVEQGARRIASTPSSARTLEEVWYEATASRTSRTEASGRRCATYLKSAAKQCRRRVVRISQDEFADHCPGHLNASERQRHEQWQQQIQTRQPLRSAQGNAIVSTWLEQRQALRGWLLKAIVPGIDPMPDGQ